MYTLKYFYYYIITHLSEQLQYLTRAAVILLFFCSFYNKRSDMHCPIYTLFVIVTRHKLLGFSIVLEIVCHTLPCIRKSRIPPFY